MPMKELMKWNQFLETKSFEEFSAETFPRENFHKQGTGANIRKHTYICMQTYTHTHRDIYIHNPYYSAYITINKYISYEQGYCGLQGLNQPQLYK